MSSAPARRWIARTALIALAASGVWLAAAPAVAGSRIVLATAGGSPAWLLGPLRSLGAQSLAGGGAGWAYYSVLMLAMGCYALVVWLAPQLSARAVWTAVIGLHLLFLLAPPLLSQDVFSYIAYARLGVVHHLNPYAHRPLDIASDPVFGFAGSKNAVDVYGPYFTLGTYPLGRMSVPLAFWTLKLVACASSLGLVAIVNSLARRVGALPARAVALLGLCPATLVHVVGGAHNEALTMLVLFAGIALATGGGGALDGGRARAGGFVAALAGGVKASAAVPLPFMLAASPRRARMFAGMALAALCTLAAALAGFGADALDGLNLISANQNRTSRWSLPHRGVDALDTLFGGVDRAAAADALRMVFAVLLAIVVIWLLWRSYRRPETWIANAGWATLGVLLASAWLVPWYLLWLLPFAALARCRALQVATIAFAAYTMAIAIPF